mmetsp:Transcript_24772/g.43636  ORF Transcript_24772/g.43636 Transcript_24772/m.43636 type:complete len:234 (-) Transcript_24772:549-1250(-)
MAARAVYLPNLKVNRRSQSTFEIAKANVDAKTERMRKLHTRQFSMSTVDTEKKLSPLKSERKFKSAAVKLSVQLYSQLAQLNSAKQRDHMNVRRLMSAVRALEGLVSESGWLSSQMWKLLDEIKAGIFADSSQFPLELRHDIYQEHEELAGLSEGEVPYFYLLELALKQLKEHQVEDEDKYGKLYDENRKLTSLLAKANQSEIDLKKEVMRLEDTIYPLKCKLKSLQQFVRSK